MDQIYHVHKNVSYEIKIYTITIFQVTVNMNIENRPSAILPAVTICNQNALKLSVVAEFMNETIYASLGK